MPTKYQGYLTTLSAVFSTKTFIFHEIRGILPSGSPRLPLFFEPGKSIFDIKDDLREAIGEQMITDQNFAIQDRMTYRVTDDLPDSSDRAVSIAFIAQKN